MGVLIYSIYFSSEAEPLPCLEGCSDDTASSTVPIKVSPGTNIETQCSEVLYLHEELNVSCPAALVAQHSSLFLSQLSWQRLRPDLVAKVC